MDGEQGVKHKVSKFAKLRDKLSPPTLSDAAQYQKLIADARMSDTEREVLLSLPSMGPTLASHPNPNPNPSMGPTLVSHPGGGGGLEETRKAIARATAVQELALKRYIEKKTGLKQVEQEQP